MKTRRPIIHVVLALLLLFSQQLGLAHMVSHLGALSTPQGEAVQLRENGDKPLSQVLLELSCDQCLAFAQVATALPFDVPSPPAVTPGSFIAHSLSFERLALPMQSMYQSRAPPAAC